MLDAAMSPIGNDLLRLLNQNITLIRSHKPDKGTLTMARPSGRTENALYWVKLLDDSDVIAFNEDEVEKVCVDDKIITMK